MNDELKAFAGALIAAPVIYLLLVLVMFL